MARLNLTPKIAPGSFPALPLAALAADIGFVPAGASFADGAGFAMTGNDLLLVWNKNAAAQTVTISSVADEYNRKGDIQTYQVAAGTIAVFGPFKQRGWMQPDGKLYIAASVTDVNLAVITLPS